jgi:phage baseplate assembly protein W
MTIITPWRLYKDLDLNFTRHPTTNDVAKVVDINSVKQAIKIAVLTRFSERLFDPSNGSPVYGRLFEPIDPINTEVMRRSVEQVIQNHEPRVIINEIFVTPNTDQRSYEISIYFRVVGIPLPVTFSFTLHRLR